MLDFGLVLNEYRTSDVTEVTAWIFSGRVPYHLLFSSALYLIRKIYTTYEAFYFFQVLSAIPKKARSNRSILF